MNYGLRNYMFLKTMARERFLNKERGRKYQFCFAPKFAKYLHEPVNLTK